MKSPTMQHVRHIASNKRHQHKRVALLSVLAALVVLGVVHTLLLNGRAATKQEQVLSCPVTGTVAHHHDDNCYDAEGKLICKLPEVERHVHNDSCYREERTLVCGQAEAPAHWHDDSCYDEEGNLVCGLEETAGHTHSDSCYKVERTLVCGKEEVTEEHQHGPGCFKTVTTEVADDDSMPEQTFEHHFTDKNDKLVLKVFVDAPEGALPKGATMKAEWVPQKKLDTDLIDEAVAKKTDGRINGYHAVDITFRDADGNEIEPQKKVTVTLTSGKIANDDIKPVLVHVESEKEAIERAEAQGKKKVEIEAQVVDPLSSKQLKKRDLADRDDQLVFDSDQFSVYAIVYTVDFHYDVDGKTYDLALQGGDAISLRELLAGLKVFEAKDADLFMAEVKDVEFSDTSLVAVAHVGESITAGELRERFGLEAQYSAEVTDEQVAAMDAKAFKAGDWALLGLLPFDSEETLTVTMANGDVLTIKVTDAQLKKTVISDKGDTYEITVTYGEDAQIPEGAELRVTEIEEGTEHYQENVEAVNAELQNQDEAPMTNPAQFDIAIVVDGKEVEPAEGSTVQVEIKLVKSVLEETVSTENDPAAEDVSLQGETVDEEGTGLFLFNGQEIAPESAALIGCRIVHITEEGTAEIIEDVESDVTDDEIIMQFATKSFSDYTIQGVTNVYGLNGLPDTIYVGDEIYMQNCADMWVTNIGTVVSETKYDGDGFKSVRATNPGTFQICHKNNWNNENPDWWNCKTITVLASRSEGNYPGTTPPATIDTIENASIGLKLDLFDYDLDDYLDNRFNNKDYGDHLNNFKNHGINADHSLKFWGSGITDSSYGAHNNYVEHGVTNIVNNTTDTGKAGGYPVLKADGKSLDYLFTPSDGTDKKAYTNVDGLFKKDGDYYVYDSDQNYAWYNPDTNSFEVYNGTYKQKLRGDGGEQASQVSTKNIGFFPFHKWDQDYDLFVNWNKNLNHHFGMSMSVDFSMPKDPKAVKDSNGNDIVFNFSGDDDLWVFIDGKLAMDIGGIHQPTTGSINFATKTVNVNGNNQSGFDFSNLYDGKDHTLQVFYIERGGCDSNCKIQFNLTRYGDVECDKVDADDNTTLLPGAVFGLYKDQNCAQPLMESLNNGNSRVFIAESDENGHVEFKDVPLGTYYMKEISSPDGYPIDPTIHPVVVYLDETGVVKVKVTIDGQAVEDGVKITNKKPKPIDLGIKKVWQDMAGEVIQVSSAAKAKFELKRIRTHEEYRDTPVQDEQKVSKLVVGWVHNGQTHTYKEYEFVSGRNATVSWGYANGYEGARACVVNGQTIDKSYVGNNVISEALTMPGVGQTATFYIVDDSETGDAITSINVAGPEYIGNSGGGFIRTYTTISEPDTSFVYTDNNENVQNNQIELPINNSWQYTFTDLPIFGKVGGTTYTYSYYLEEVSTENPSQTTVVYQASDGTVFQKASDAETSTSGTQTVVNKVPMGYLKVTKNVTYNGATPTTAAQKSKLAGTYKFHLYTSEQCTDADIVKGDNDEPLEISITISNDGQAVSSAAVQLPVGEYWLQEFESTNPAMYPSSDNPLKVTVAENHTSEKPLETTFTNNYDENNGPDKISLDIEKKFVGLDNKRQVPADFTVTLTYTVDGASRTVTLGHSALDTGANGEKINGSWSEDGFVWHWRVTNIPTEATGFAIKEAGYGNALGYDWRSASLNGDDITATVDDSHPLNVTAPIATLANVTDERRTSDGGNNTVFKLMDGDILLTKLTADQGTLVISKKSLNSLERESVVKGWPKQGHFSRPPHYFSIEEHPDGFQYGGKRITFSEKDGVATVKFTQNASAQEAVFAVTYDSESSLNNANLQNEYIEKELTIEIVKVDVDHSEKKLGGAVFTLRQIADKAPDNNGVLESMPGTEPVNLEATANDTGKTSYDRLTHGYYELKEKTPPTGYVLTSQNPFYFKVENGKISWLEKESGKPSTWSDATQDDIVSFTAATPASGTQAATNATFTVKNEPGAELPAAGGLGTAITNILGAMAISAVVFTNLLQRRREFGFATASSSAGQRTRSRRRPHGREGRR